MSMGFEHLEVEVEAGVGTVWLNRPEKLNALSADMWSDIPIAVEALEEDDSVRVIVLAGRGDAFTVGIDIEMLATMMPSGASQAKANRNLYSLIRRLQRTASVFAESTKPVIASVQGYCLGAGMDLITACDIRVATDAASFSVREVKMGLVADIGTLQRLPSIVGEGHAAELALTGRDIDAARAARIGLLNHTYRDVESLRDGTLEVARAIASNSPFVTAGIKKVLGHNRGHTVQESLEYVAQWNASYLISNDLMEAVSAFAEKRPPKFTGD